MVADKNLTVKEKTDVLSWFVDNMRQEVLNYFEKENLVQDMQETEKVKLYS